MLPAGFQPIVRRLLEKLGLRAVRCPACRSTACEPRTRLEKHYVAAEHQAYESTAGWVYGHVEVQISLCHCTACGLDFRERRQTVRTHKARGALSAKKSGGYGTE